MLESVTDEGTVGGKAWNLSRMLRLGLPVPRGFVLTDTAFQQFLADNRLHDQIDTLSAGINLTRRQTLRSASEAIQALVLAAALPDAVIAALKEGHRQIGSDRTLIVRSSAVGEDSKSSSFAGQLDSFRDIHSGSEIERALVRCWASCWSERALYYQLSRGVRIDRMGVVVQEQVVSKTAGVLFTISPDQSVTSSEMLGEYCFGHGEDLVSGRINPGRFTVSREGFCCRFLADPEQPDEETGLHSRLDETVILRLQQIGILLEHEFRGAQDIEWTIDHDGVTHVVQSRPVTVTAGDLKKNRPPRSDPDSRPMVWSNANINENYPDPVSPFLYSIAADGYYHYFRNLASAFGIAADRIKTMEEPLRGIIGVHGARLYYNLSNIHAALRMAPFGEHLVEYFNVFVGAREVTGALAQTESFSGQCGGRLAKHRELLHIIIKTSWQFLFLERRVTAFERTVDRYAALFHPEVLAKLPLSELHTALRSFHDIRCHRWREASLADVAAMIGYGLLKRLLGQAFPDREHSALHNTLLQGLPDLVSARPVVDLWRLSRSIREDGDLRRLFACDDNGTIRDGLLTDVRFADFRRDFEEYLETWGFRCSGELMLTVKSFQEDPRGVIALLKNYAALDGNSPTEALRRQEEERLTATGRVLRQLKRHTYLKFLPWPNEGTAAAIVLRWTQRAVALRERARLKQSLLYSRCRRILVRIGEELTAQGFLARQEDVFFLTLHELTALISGYAMFPHGTADLVALRQREHERLSSSCPPDSLVLSEGTYLPEVQDQEGGAGPEPKETHGDMVGTGACGGRVTARAVVLSDVSESGQLTAGDILVTRQTDPGWAPVFFVVSGLIMERGGMLSHGAIIAREYGIPTVVGVQDATRKIRSGQTVTVDGDVGNVRIVA
jgi:pyruvate,water dikinase